MKKIINTEKIRTFGGKVIGQVETDAEGNQTVRDFYGRIIATYDKSCNVTRDFYGRILTQGNTAVGMLYAKAGSDPSKPNPNNNVGKA